MPDSYESFRQSVENRVRRDLPPPVSERELAAYIDRIMIEEARGGELQLAYLRVGLIAPFLALAVDAVLRGATSRPFGASPTVAWAATTLLATWFVLAAGLVAALRRGWYRPWIPRYMPVLNAAMLVLCFLLPIVGDRRAAVSPEAVACLTVLCAFLGVSGGLRMSRTASRTGMVLAVAVFVTGAAASRLAPLAILAVAIALLCAGLLSATVTRIIRRLVVEEVSKVTLTQMYHDAAREIDAREQVLKVVSHELRNPLSTIGMGASLMIDLPDMPADTRRQHLERVRRAGDRANRLVEDLLQVAKLEAGRVTIRPREIRVEPMLRELHESLAPHAGAASITLDLDIADDLPPVTADQDRVVQVITNLVTNAIKFTPGGGRITIGAHPSPGGVHFSVADTGAGIPEDQLDRIFARFWQANAADRRGIGLGLSIAKGIMDAHGARLWVESRVGEGTTFHFVLGRILPEAAGPGSLDRRQPTASAARSTPDSRALPVS